MKNLVGGLWEQILGEKLVLAANNRSGLVTIALRPSGIFGEHDPLLVPLTVANAKKGKMKFIIGSGKNLMDFTYVGNVAQAHLLVHIPPFGVWAIGNMHSVGLWPSS